MKPIEPPPDKWRALMRLGDVGPDVSAWRLLLVLDGHDLEGPGDPNAFTVQVHNATMSWQRARGLRPDGVVGAKTREQINTAERWPAVVHPFDPDDVPFIEARHWNRAAGPQAKHLIVLHCMEYPETATSAEWCADFFAGPNSPEASAHYAVDADSVICMVQPDRIAWHAPGANKHGIGIEHSGYARQSRTQWLDEYGFDMLHLSAKLTAYLCARFAIPAVYVHGALLANGAPGITTHAEVSRVFKRSTHTDPGPHFPLQDYIAWVHESMPPKAKA